MCGFLWRCSANSASAMCYPIAHIASERVNPVQKQYPAVRQPGRTSRPFILPSDGRIAASFPSAPHICAGFHSPTTACDPRHLASPVADRRTNSSCSDALRSETDAFDDPSCTCSIAGDVTVALRFGSGSAALNLSGNSALDQPRS